MMTLTKRIAVAGTALAVLATSFISADAMPLNILQPAAQSAMPVEQVQWRGYDDGYRPGPGYYRGYRGYDGPRPGYRRHHDGHWYPLAAFAAGALIGGAIASQPRPAPAAPAYSNGINPRHYEWCSGRYRSYDSYSNTFVTYSGARQQCYSPYY
nr:BA14K family protein [Agrobacterium vitis]